MNKIDEIIKLCRPIAEYLEKNYNPYCTIIINAERIKLVQDEISIPFSRQND